MATTSDQERTFNEALPTTEYETTMTMLAVIGLATHLAFSLEQHDGINASEHVALALLRSLGDIRQYQEEDLAVVNGEGKIRKVSSGD